MKRTKLECKKCGEMISKSNYTRHIDSTKCINNRNNRNIEDYKIMENLYQCPYCDKQYTKMGIGTHIWRTHGDGIDWKNNNIGYEYNRRGTNGFITGSQDTVSEETKQKLSTIMKDQFKSGERSGWNRVEYYTNNIEHGNKAAELYIAEFEFENHKFIKIGITSKGFEERYNHTMYRKYKITLLKSVLMTNLEAAKKEDELFKKYKQSFHFELDEDLGVFHGRSECFYPSILTKIL